MKKKLLVLLLALAMILTIGIVALAADGEGTEVEGKEITISYVRSRSTFDAPTNLDTTAYSGGKQVVKAGEKFTLPTKSAESNTGVEGYQLIWYTQDGQTFKGGQEVSFEEDVALYRCNAKECYTAGELGIALSDQNPTRSGILMADMEATGAIGFDDWDTVVMIMNGFNLNFTSNSSGLIGNQRTQRHIYGEGTISAHNPDGKKGEYYFFNTDSHGYAGTNNRTVIGKDIVIDAPNYYLSGEANSFNNHYVWTRVYGTVKCYGLFYTWSSGNRCPYYEFYDGCNVTFTGKQLFWDTNNQKNFNYHAFDTVIYGGTFYLPAEAANQSFWTNDYKETLTNHDGTKSYASAGTNQLTKDNIIIYGGSFVTADGSMPAIADYIANTYAGGWQTGGNGIITNNNTSTYEIPYYGKRPGIKLEFTTYSDSALGTINITDYVGSSLSGKSFKYRVNKLENGEYEVVVYESRMDGETEVWDVVSDELAIKYGLGGTIMVSYDLTRENLELYAFDANNAVYQTVVPADCEHSFAGAPVDATCQHVAYADYNCSKCAHNVYFSWGEKAPHAYEQTDKVEPTASTHGSTSFICNICGDAKTYATTIDPSTFDVTVTIKNDDGTTEDVTVLATDVFEFSTIGGNGAYIYTLSGIKAFGEYNIRNIYGVVIPNGIMYVRITTQNLEKYENADWGLEVLETSENATITIHNFGNLSCLKTFKIGKGTNIVIEGQASYYSPSGENRSNSKLETVDFSAGNITAKVMSKAFQDRPIKNLLLGANSSYTFQSESFRNIKATELEIPTPISLICGSNAFRDADFTSLKFPNGTAENMNTWSFGSECFRYCPIESVEFGQYGTYKFENSSFANLKLTGALTFAANSNYEIQAWAFSSNTITAIDFSAGNINLTVTDSGLKDMTNVTEFKFGENSTYTFNGKSLGKTGITKFTLAPNSTYTFHENFLENNTTIEEIDASADNITITFNKGCFNGRTAFKTLTFGKNATLTFNEDCFKSTAVEALEFGENYTITFNSYSLRNFAIKEIDIKKGSTVTFGGNWANGSTIETLTLGSDSNYTFNNGAFTYSTLFTELVFGENTTCRFKDWVFSNANSKITTIDLSAPGANVTLDGSALRTAPALTTVLFNSDNGTFVINNNAFRESKAITTFKIDGEGSTYTFNGNDTFYTTNITELVLGKNSTYTFGQWMFTGTSQIQKIDASAEGVNVTFDVNSFRGKSTITELLINGKNATYTFKNESFRECSGITEIVLGEGSTYNFNSGCFNSSNNITRFDGSASGITAIIGNNVFQNKSQITEVSFGPNSTYTIGEYAFSNTVAANDIVFAGTSSFTIGKEAFRYADFPSITFEDNCNVTFTGGSAFCDCDKATSLYIGKNIAITNYPFKNFKALETLYIMPGVTHTNEYEFEHAGSSDFSTPLYVYNHSTDLTFTKGMFNNCDGIILYTATDNIGTRTDVFSNCADGTGYKAWTVYLGIPYPVLVNGDIDPTCEEYGYNTYFCDCGHDCGFYLTETTTVNKYENKHNITDSTEVAEQVGTYEVTPIDPKGHDTLGTLLDVVYNSFLEKGTGTYICSACGKTHTVENAVDAIFEWLGYSTNASKNEFAIGYRINHVALEQYETLSGNKLVYGVVGAITENLGGFAPFDEALDPSVKKVSLEAPRANETGDIAEICFRITGFKASHMDLGITMSGYVTETTTDDEGNESSKTVYIQSTQTDNPSSNSINNYLATLPNKEEDEVA